MAIILPPSAAVAFAESDRRTCEVANIIRQSHENRLQAARNGGLYLDLSEGVFVQLGEPLGEPLGELADSSLPGSGKKGGKPPMVTPTGLEPVFSP